MIKHYDDVILADIIANNPDDFGVSEVDLVRVILPTSADFEYEMAKKGYYWADRTLQTTISLNKLPVDVEKFVRLPIDETDKYKDEILKIAVASFSYDRRFHITPKCSSVIAAKVLRCWVNELGKTLVCLYKDKVIGFLSLKEAATDTLFVHLAAVDEKYRMSGAAMALYAKACLIAKERGYKKLEGRISSQNTAVMNVYAAFGATFSQPQDIYLKEVKNDA